MSRPGSALRPAGRSQQRPADAARPSQQRPADAARPEATIRPAMVALLGAMTALGAVTVDMYLPSLPTVAADLGTSDAAVQLTVSAVLAGAALGQLIVGPLSDRYGRRRPALFGIGLHVVASLLCVVVPSITALIGLRVLQGVGNAAASITAMAVIRDRLTGGRAARVISRLMLVIGVAPLFAPTLGGLIAGAAGWRAVFAVLALVGVALGVLVWRALPETLPAQRRTTAGLAGALRGYRALLADRRFAALAVLPGLAMGALISYVVGSPFVLQGEYGLSANQFAMVFAVNGIGLVVGAQLNAAIVHRIDPLHIVRVALPASVVVAVALVLATVSGFGGVSAVLAGLWAILFLIGFITGNAAAIALSRHGERAGTAAAVIGATQAGVAGLVSPLVGVMGSTATAMAMTMAGCLLLATGVLLVAMRNLEPTG